MNAHEREGAAAAAGAMELHGGASPGYWDGSRRRWSECDTVLFRHNGDTFRGFVVAADYGSQRDSYTVRYHVAGGGSEVVRVLDRDILIY